MNREELQEKFAEDAFQAKKGILHLTMRFGKCRVGVLLFQKLVPCAKILVIYPDNKIRKSWEDEFEQMNYQNPNLVLSSTISMHKHVSGIWDWVVFDEIHAYSEAQIGSVKLLAAQNSTICFSGSLSKGTKTELKNALKFVIIGEYLQEEAIDNNIVADYELNIITVELDNQQLIQYSKKKKTEKQQFSSYSFLIGKFDSEGKDTMFLRLARKRLFQNSIAKIHMTRKLLKEFKNERVLVFCGLKEMADQLGIPVQSNESKNLIEGFSQGEGNHLATLKMGKSGVTYNNLDKLIITDFSSNGEEFIQMLSRAISLDFNNPDKLAKIYLIVTNEPVERKWLRSSLSLIPKDKIKYIYE